MGVTEDGERLLAQDGRISTRRRLLPSDWILPAPKCQSRHLLPEAGYEGDGTQIVEPAPLEDVPNTDNRPSPFNPSPKFVPPGHIRPQAGRQAGRQRIVACLSELD